MATRPFKTKEQAIKAQEIFGGIICQYFFEDNFDGEIVTVWCINTVNENIHSYKEEVEQIEEFF